MNKSNASPEKKTSPEAKGSGKESSTITLGINLGWKVWFILLIAYWLLLSLPPRLSLVLSFLGGVCSGLIAAWWQSSETSQLNGSSPEASPSESNNFKKKN
ncbi:hypothetical protein [Trichothermofontia sp.]